MRLTLSALLLGAVMAATNAFATTQPNRTGLWIRLDESGWGLNLIHQGDTMFGTLFVYGADNRARWFSASAIVCDDGANHCGGPLYESSGAPFNAAFDESTVTRRQVGDLSIDFTNTSSATVTYTVDNVRVTKPATPFSWRWNDISGSYTGVQSSTANGAETADPITMTINVDPQAGTFRIESLVQRVGSCVYTGSARAANMSVHLSGSYLCNDGRAGSTSTDIDPTTDGFVAAWLPPGTRVAMARNGPQQFVNNGWMSDLWLTDRESGWGLNLIGQGDTLFGTLFVYDTDRRPKWYSASSLTYTGAGAPEFTDGRGRYQGELVESTGPWYGNVTFDRNAVTRRVVGTMTVDFVDGMAATLTYTIDGVTVSKLIKPYAFRANRLTGTYYMVRVTKETNAATVPLATTIDRDGTRMTTADTNGTCVYDGFSNQFGQRATLNGSWACGTTSGTFTLSDAEVTADGFIGYVVFGGQGRYHIAAVRTGS